MGKQKEFKYYNDGKYHIGDLVSCGFYREGDVNVIIIGIRRDENGTYWYLFEDRESDGWIHEVNVEKLVLTAEVIEKLKQTYIGKTIFYLEGDIPKKMVIVNYNVINNVIKSSSNITKYTNQVVYSKKDLEHYIDVKKSEEDKKYKRIKKLLIQL